MADSRSGGVVITTSPELKPKGFIEALSEIEQYYSAEQNGSEIPERFFTTKNKIEFWEVGFKGAFMGGLIQIFLTPLAIGVFEQMIPVFGSKTPSDFDKAFVMMMALSFSIGYAIFIGTIGKYYVGQFTKSMIRNFLSGVFFGAILKMLLGFLFFHFIYLVVLKEERVAWWLLLLKPFFSMDTLNHTFQWIIAFKPIFLTSAGFLVLTTAIFIGIPLTSIGITVYKTSQRGKQIQ